MAQYNFFHVAVENLWSWPLGDTSYSNLEHFSKEISFWIFFVLFCYETQEIALRYFLSHRQMES